MNPLPLLLILLTACAAPPATIPHRAAPPVLSLFTDPRASRAGDLVTVQILENSRASRRVTSKAEKEGDQSADFMTSSAGKTSRAKIGLQTVNETNAKSGLERRGSLVATVTARIVEEMPDGNFRIEGEQDIQLEKGVQTLRVSGILRPADIGPGNIVVSTRLASCRIHYGSRKEPALHRQGLLAWVFGWIF